MNFMKPQNPQWCLLLSLGFGQQKKTVTADKPQTILSSAVSDSHGQPGYFIVLTNLKAASFPPDYFPRSLFPLSEIRYISP